MKYTLITLLIIVLSGNIYADLWSEAENIQKELYNQFEDTNYVKKDFSIKYSKKYSDYYKGVKEAQSVTEINIIVKKYLNEYIMEIQSQDYIIKDQEFLELISILHTPIAVYEGVFYNRLPWKKPLNNISTWIANYDSNPKSSYAVFDDYWKWVKEFGSMSNYKWSDYNYYYENGKKKNFHYSKVARRILKSKFSNYSDNIYSDEWYLMIKEYVKIRKFYFEIENQLDNVVKILSQNYTKNKQKIRILDQYIRTNGLYFRKLDKIARYHIFDSPIRTISTHGYLIYMKNTPNWFLTKGQKAALKKEALELSKVAELIDYTVMDYTRKNFIQYGEKMYKKKIGEKEWDQLKLDAKLSLDWLKLLPEIEID